MPKKQLDESRAFGATENAKGTAKSQKPGCKEKLPKIKKTKQNLNTSRIKPS